MQDMVPLPPGRVGGFDGNPDHRTVAPEYPGFAFMGLPPSSRGFGHWESGFSYPDSGGNECRHSGSSAHSLSFNEAAIN